MAYTHKFEAFSLVKEGSIYKILPFNEQQKSTIETSQDKKKQIKHQSKIKK